MVKVTGAAGCQARFFWPPLSLPYLSPLIGVMFQGELLGRYFGRSFRPCPAEEYLSLRRVSLDVDPYAGFRRSSDFGSDRETSLTPKSPPTLPHGHFEGKVTSGNF